MAHRTNACSKPTAFVVVHGVDRNVRPPGSNMVGALMLRQVGIAVGFSASSPGRLSPRSDAFLVVPSQMALLARPDRARSTPRVVCSDQRPRPGCSSSRCRTVLNNIRGVAANTAVRSEPGWSAAWPQQSGQDPGQLLGRALLLAVHGVEHHDPTGERRNDPLGDLELLLGPGDVRGSARRGVGAALNWRALGSFELSFTSWPPLRGTTSGCWKPTSRRASTTSTTPP